MFKESGAHNLLNTLECLWLSKLKKFTERSFRNVTYIQMKILTKIIASTHIKTQVSGNLSSYRMKIWTENLKI